MLVMNETWCEIASWKCFVLNKVFSEFWCLDLGRNQNTFERKPGSSIKYFFNFGTGHTRNMLWSESIEKCPTTTGMSFIVAQPVDL